MWGAASPWCPPPHRRAPGRARCWSGSTSRPCAAATCTPRAAIGRGDALPRQALAENRIPENEVRIDYAGGHPEALLALTNGAVDAAEINPQQLASATEAGTFDPSKFRKVWTSDPIPNDPITVRGDMDPAFKTALRDALLNLPPQAVGEIGALLDVSPPGPLVPVDRSTYQPLFDLATTLGLTEEDV
ncbi:MAG: PhnD/SsuA/transferrin family substrate-binding protein [Pseudonocardia sp.]|nr:PhnD/SsuA/transferrin family substrate-binding protein [Pseudonocardia sp.]